MLIIPFLPTTPLFSPTLSFPITGTCPSHKFTRTAVMSSTERSRQVGGSDGASYTVTPRPLQLNISSANRALQGERRRLAESLAELAKKELVEWEQWSFQLPQTVFESVDPVVSTPDLMRTPDASELPQIVRDESTGAQRRLTVEQMAQIKKNATFSFPSIAYPSTQHKWKLAAWIQVGSEYCRNVWIRAVASAYDHVFVRMGRRIVVPVSSNPYAGDVSRFPNLSQAVKSCAMALFAVVSLMIGLPSSRPFVEGEHEIFAMANQEFEAFVREKTTVHSNESLQCDPVRDILENDLELQPKPEAFFSQARCGDYGPIGDSSPDLGSNLSGGKVSVTRQQDNYDRFRRASRSVIEREQSETSQTEYAEVETRKKLISREETKRAREDLLRKVQNELGFMSHGVTVRVQNRYQANFARIDVRNKAEEKVDARRDALSKTFQEKYPFRSKSTRWLNNQVDNVLHRGGEYEQIFKTAEIELIQELKDQGLEKEAVLEEYRQEFLRPGFAERLTSHIHQKKPSEKIRLRFQIYNVKRWQILETDPELGLPRRLQDKRDVLVPTSVPGWRLVLLVRRGACFVVNSVYSITIENLWRGRFGLQALFRSKPFPATWGTEDGASEVSPSTTTIPLREKLTQIWNAVRQRRRAFELSEDSGFLSKDDIRWLFGIYNTLRGVLSSGVTFLAHVAVTLINVVVSAVLLVSTPVWALVYLPCAHLFSFLCFDSFAQSRSGISGWVYPSAQWESSHITYCEDFDPTWIPLLWHFMRFTFKGLLQGVLAIVAVPVLLLTAVVQIIGVGTYCVTRSLWDLLWRWLLIRLGRWPANDSWLAVRIGGPGISSSYFFRVSQPVIERCLRARLEQMELRIAQKQLTSVIDKPEGDFRAFVQDVNSFLVDSGQIITSTTFTRLKNVSRARLRELQSAMDRRGNVLRLLLKMPVDRDHIRPLDSRDETLARSEHFVQQFYEERLKPLGEEYTLDLWKRAGACPGQFRFLACHLLETMFDSDFLTPFEITDETIEIPITADSFGEDKET